MSQRGYIRVRDMRAQAKQENVLAYVEKHFYSRDSNEYKIIECAIEDVKAAYKDECGSDALRRNGDTVYSHAFGVAYLTMYCITLFPRKFTEKFLRCTFCEAIVAALFHDIYEDRPAIWPIARIADLYGRRVALGVDLLSKDPADALLLSVDRLERYVSRLEESGFLACILIKLCDNLFNLRTLESDGLDRWSEQLRESEAWYLPLADHYKILHQEFVRALHELRTRIAAEAA